MSIPNPPSDPLNNTIGLALYRITMIEQDFLQFKQQLQLYETTRENDLKLEAIRMSAHHIEADLLIVKTSQADIHARITLKETESLQRDTEAEKSQNMLQIKVLVGILSTISMVIVGVLIFYLTHR